MIFYESYMECDLDVAYEAANLNQDRLINLQDWDLFDDMTELIENIEDWEWLKNSDDQKASLTKE